MGKDVWNAFVEQVNLEGAPSGPLAGHGFAVKDNIGVAGRLFTAGHPLFNDRRAVQTAPAVTSLLDGGASFAGMTQTDAGGFGTSTPQTQNPVDSRLTAGGSSGGSAAAVAAGLCDFALGTDTGGSVRIPAACTGLVSFKPTFGRISNDGVWPLAPSLDHVGLIAGDLNILQRAGLVLLESKDREAPRQLNIAVEIDQAGIIDGPIVKEMDQIAYTLTVQGHQVDRINIPDRWKMAGMHGLITLTEAAAIYTGYDHERLGRAAITALSRIENISVEVADEAREWSREAIHRIQALLDHMDILISPTLPVAPPSVEARRIAVGGEEVPVVIAMTLLTGLANLSGEPVISFPNPSSPASPGTGIQLMGKANSDEILFQAAKLIEHDLRVQNRLVGGGLNG